MSHSFKAPIVDPGTFEEVIWDIETNGLLPAHVDPPFCMDRIHCLVVRCVQSGQVLRFRNNAQENSIAEGVALLMKARKLIGHNILDFDIPAVQLIYPWFEPEGIIIDTLVMVRMCFADQKEKDFRLAAGDKLPGRLIGTMGLESWGYRLGLHKGDYKKDREEELKALHKEKGLEKPTPEELHHYVWGMWSEGMEDYCDLDVEVNTLVYISVADKKWAEEATIMEHQIHDLMVTQERNGFVFNEENAEKLTAHFEEEYGKLAADAIDQIGTWFRPVKKREIDTYVEEDGEDESRRVWGDVTYPKKTMNRVNSRKKAIESGDYTKMQPNVYEGAGYVKVEAREFNPNSRPQIIDRMQTLYGWEPRDFTEKKTAIVNDEVLRELENDIPLAGTLAELFFYKKRLGQVADGKNGWLKLVRDDGRIHGRVNVGGTVSGRATHSSPNVSQVPGVNAVEFKDRTKGEKFLVEHADAVNPWGAPVVVSSKWKEAKGEWSIVTRGRTGGYGYDCRELFTVPPGYKLMGCDLSGIEFRCLANLTAEFDGGELIDVVLNGDIHQRNADLAGISRSVAKRLLYACVDMETEALTKEGWKHYEDLRVGELVLTYNMEKDCQEWKPIQHLHYVEDAEVVNIKGRGVDLICTPDHRWPVLRRTTANGVPTDVREYRRTDELCAHMRVIANAPFSDDAPSAHLMEGNTNKTEICQSRTWGCQKLDIIPVSNRPVWCMTTENSSFVIRRGNQVTQTGNCMYGGGDSKLGSIVEPFSSETRQKSLGKDLRAKLMRAMPSLQQAIRAIHKEMRLNNNTIRGLDGRRLYARSRHSALNLRLQSDGALIAKKWCLLADDMFFEEGWDHGPDLDYAFCSWSHDEIQVAVREEIAERAAKIAEDAAPLAGKHFNFQCPVAAEAGIGMTWAETH